VELCGISLLNFTKGHKVFYKIIIVYYFRYQIVPGVMKILRMIIFAGISVE